METKKKSMILTIIAIITFVALVVGATYAYFKATGGIGSNSKVNVETATTDLLTFKFSKGIAIYADQSNFGKGAGSKSDSTKGTATLTASNSKNIESTKDRYNIYFVIDNNDFIYTTSDNKTELLLQVTDPNGNEVTAIDGLLYKENGFDITTRTGGFLLVPDYDISALRGETTKQDWNITVTLINLDTNQSENMGKSFSGKLYMTKDQMSSYELSQIKNMNVTTTYNSIDTTLEVTSGSAELTKYYFGNEKVSSNTTSMLSINKLAVSDVTFVETTNPNYKFTNLDSNSTYKIYSYAVDKNGIKTNMYETEVKTDSYVIPTIDSVTHTSTLNSITVNVTASKGSNEVVKYYYSKDNGETYTESTKSSYTFTSLADTAEYKIKIKVEDSDGKFSTVYSESISTVTYVLPSITAVTPTTKYNQIKVVTTATGGTNKVSKYYYSINDSEYVEDGTSHTFTGLTEQTTYTIKVKVVDTQGRESVVYETSAKTDAYKLPTVTIASTSSTYNSVTINVNGTNGDGTITEYYYSKDNGSNYTASTSNSYTFTNLTSGVTFYLKVYVKDSNGRISSVVSTSQETPIIYFNAVVKTNNATASDTKKVAQLESSPEFTISGNEGYKFANYTCTNSQDGNFNNGTFTIENITSDTECTINYVANLTGSATTEYGTTSKYKIRIYGTTEDVLVGTPIYTGDDWTYNDFLNAYEKDFEYVGNNTIPDVSEMFTLDGYKDNNNYTRVSKELDGDFTIVPVYPSVYSGRAVFMSRAGNVEPGIKLIIWTIRSGADGINYSERLTIKNENNTYYKMKLYNFDYGYLVYEPTSEIQTWDGLNCEMGVKSSYCKYNGIDFYARFGDWKQIKLAYEDETSSLQEWAFIYDSHGNFFIRNKQSGDYVRNGSTISNPYIGPTASKYSQLNIMVYNGKYTEGTVITQGNWEIPVITTPVFEETDAYRYFIMPVEDLESKSFAYYTEYYKYLRYSDTSLEYDSIAEDCNEDNSCVDGASAYPGTIKDIKTTISKGTSNYLLSDIDGDIVHLYPEWIKE